MLTILFANDKNNNEIQSWKQISAHVLLVAVVVVAVVQILNVPSSGRLEETRDQVATNS